MERRSVEELFIGIREEVELYQDYISERLLNLTGQLSVEMNQSFNEEEKLLL